MLDGSRWDRLHISSEFQTLQKQGTLLNNVSAAYPYTFAALNAIFTGLFGKENGVNAYYKMFRLKDTVPFLPELLQKNGYFTSCDLISDKVISKRGFDIHQSHDEYVDDLTIRHPELIKKTISEANGKPIFTFLQYSRIHTVTVSEVLKKFDWDDEEFYAQKEKNLTKYDEVFLETTSYAKKIQDIVNELNISDNTIIIFFCDHGTGIGERFGERNYGIFTYEETLRTYYLFIGPNILKNNSSNELLSSTRLYSTLLDLCGVKLDSLQIEKSLKPFLFGTAKYLTPDKYTFTETGGLQGPFPSPKEPNVFCIKTKTHKLIYFKTVNEWKLFNLIDDPKELNNLYGKSLDVEYDLKQKLLDWINR